MNSNIGKLLKNIALVYIVINYLFCLIFGGYLIDIEKIGWGVFVLVLGIFGLPLFPLMLYGFGELIDKTNEIARNTKSENDNNFDSFCIKSFIESHIEFFKEYKEQYINTSPINIIIGISALLIFIFGVSYAYFHSTAMFLICMNITVLFIIMMVIKLMYDYYDNQKKDKSIKEKIINKTKGTNIGAKIFAIFMLILMIGSVIVSTLAYVLG